MDEIGAVVRTLLRRAYALHRSGREGLQRGVDAAVLAEIGQLAMVAEDGAVLGRCGRLTITRRDVRLVVLRRALSEVFRDERGRGANLARRLGAFERVRVVVNDEERERIAKFSARIGAPVALAGKLIQTLYARSPRVLDAAAAHLRAFTSGPRNRLETGRRYPDLFDLFTLDVAVRGATPGKAGLVRLFLSDVVRAPEAVVSATMAAYDAAVAREARAAVPATATPSEAATPVIEAPK